MADYDRGAYTPQTDAPLAFDPRRPSERRPMPMALIGSAVVLVVLLAGVAMVYRSGVRHAGEAPRPVGEPVMSVKTAPAPDADAAKAPPANLDVYNESAAAAPAVPSAASPVATSGSAPAFTPAPEQPAARPAPKPETLAMLAKPPPTTAARPTPAERAAVTPAPVAAAPLKPAASAATSAQAPVQAKPQKIAKLDQSEVAEAGMTRASAATIAANDETPAATHAAAAKPAAKPIAPAAASAGDAAGDPTGSVVQIGAFSSDALAHKGYADISTAMGGQMAGKVRHIQPLQRDGKTLYRTWVSGFASHADARAFCDALKAKGKTCITKG
jgi:hypothetical protein